MSTPSGPAGAVPEAELTTLWRERGIRVSLDGDGSASLAASDRALTSGLLGAGVARLDDTVAATLAREPLALKEVLGRGGMGVVHVAEQRSMRRDVALKHLTPAASEAALASLLKDAWVGALLSHPNVATVHALSVLDGEPALLMKRIDGVSWRDAIRDPSRIPPGDHEDALAFHVRVLIQVCNAVGYAHRRGVLHLDLKPENVMLGRFGEVSVLDWGLAAGFGATAPAWLPSTSELRSVAGTPDYMSPEVATGAGPRIGPATDVYLLGATLHEVLTGLPPHHGGTIVQRLYRAYRSEPPAYPASVPAALGEVAARAMHRDPSARWSSAEALRDALESFLAERRGEARVREAEEHVSTLEGVIARASEEVDVSRALGAARFSLREASEARPDHTDLVGLGARLHAAMAGWAMERGQLSLAAAHLSKLPSPSATLSARLDTLRAEEGARAARAAALEEVARDQDLGHGSRFRRAALVLWGGVLLVGNLGYGALERGGIARLGYREVLAHGFVAGFVVSGFALWRRREMFQNRANTILFSLALLTFGVLQAFWVSAALLDLPFRTAFALTSTYYLLAGGAVTALLSTRFVIAPILAAIGMFVAAFWPAFAWEAIGISSGVALAGVGLAWPVGREQGSS